MTSFPVLSPYPWPSDLRIIRDTKKEAEGAIYGFYGHIKKRGRVRPLNGPCASDLFSGIDRRSRGKGSE